jgi:septum site-determining protein MinC
MSIDTPESVRTALEFKNATLNVPSLLLHSDNLKHIEQQLLEKISQAPDFFKHSPILIDLHNINQNEQTVDIAALIQLLRDNLFLPVGIRGGSEAQNQQALILGIPYHSSRQTTTPLSDKKTEKLKTAEPVKSPEDPLENIFINTPVRSGQRIYARGDLIIAATVSAGAEIMAEGNIHVYGTLRGRALAGVQGNNNSRIFCSNLQAELISIAGNYKISDEIDSSSFQQPVQIYLQDRALIIETI